MYPLLLLCNTFLCLARLHPSHLMEDIFPGCWVNGYSYKPAKMLGIIFFDFYPIKVYAAKCSSKISLGDMYSPIRLTDGIKTLSDNLMCSSDRRTGGI